MVVRLRARLVAVQVAVSLVLLGAAGLLARSLSVMLHVDPGVDADRVAYVDVAFGDNASPATLDDVLARVARIPGVTRAAAASRLPAQRSGTTTTIVEGYTPPAGTGAVELGYTIVSPGYFDTVGLSVIEGRAFAETDIGGTSPVVIVNASAAKRFWGAAGAIGQRLRSESRPDFVRTVVGVVEDAPVTTFPEQTTPPMFYAPSGQASLGGAMILARMTGDAEPHVRTVASAISELGSSFEIAEQGTLASHLGSGLILPRTMVRVMGGVSVLALALSAIGIYAVVAFNVARRTTELGIRIALGATASQVVRMVVVETTGAVGLGLAAGLALGLLAVPRMASVLFGVPAIDPAAFGGSIAVLTLAAWAAAYLPARRAAATDPATALRTT
jgi:predicted permease